MKKRLTRKDQTPVYQISVETLPGNSSDRLPVDSETRQPIAPMAQPGYYPGFSTLSQQSFWDEATRKTVLDRVEHVPPIRFFTAVEAQVMQAVCDRLIPQDDRDTAHRIPVVNVIDDRLFSGRIDGYRYEDMPPDNEAHRLGLKAIEAIAQHLYTTSFIHLAPIGPRCRSSNYSPGKTSGRAGYLGQDVGPSLLDVADARRG